MDIFIKVCIGLGIILLLFLLIIALLFIPTKYKIDVRTNNKTSYLEAKIKTFLNIIMIDIINDFVFIRVCGIRINIRKKNKNKNDEDCDFEKIDFDKVPEDVGFFKKLKLKAYIAERKIKEKTYKFRKIVNDINEYKYKMDLLIKTVEFLEKAIKMLKPKKSSVIIEFGTGNAEITGKMASYCAILSVKYNNVSFKPNFEKSVLDINVVAEGNTMLASLLYQVAKFIKSEPVRELKKIGIGKDLKNAKK